jgi:hypothetical protein
MSGRGQPRYSGSQFPPRRAVYENERPHAQPTARHPPTHSREENPGFGWGGSAASPPRHKIQKTPSLCQK